MQLEIGVMSLQRRLFGVGLLDAFSPKMRWPAAMAAAMRSGGTVLVTATSLTLPGVAAGAPRRQFHLPLVERHWQPVADLGSRSH